MSDDVIKTNDHPEPEEGMSIRGRAQFTVILDAAGGLSVTGMIDHRVMVLGMLEMARVVLDKYWKEKDQQKQIVTPLIGMPHSLRKQ